MSDKENFIANLYPAATKISEETGMSRELILAQAAQETGWGAHVLSGTNNIFNIKAQGGWAGPTKTFNVWEIENGNKVWKDQDFRVYESIEEALRDRVKFLKDNPRYADAGLFDEGTKGNFEKEAAALQKAGYATDPNYARQLVAVYNGPTMQRAIKQAKAVESDLNSHSNNSTRHSESRPESAGSTHVLKQGSHGDTVNKLQTNLALLGYTDAQGHALQIDSQFGPATQHAVEAFQRDHHLIADGKVGSLTQTALNEDVQTRAQPTTALLSDAHHPDHGLYEQALAGVHRLDANMGRTPDHQSDRLAAGLVASAKHEGMTRIDNVALSEDGSRAFAVQDTSESLLRQFAHVQTAEAVNTPMAQSTAAAAMVKPPESAPVPCTHAPQQTGSAMSM